MPIRILKKDKNKSDPKKRFDPRTGEETNKPGGVDPRTIYRPDAKEDVKPTEMRTGGLSPKQKKIASKAPPPNKLDEKDFAVLRKEKAKGRGMGLQDESIKPGKVMRARIGKMVPLKKDPTKPISSVAPKASDILKKKKLPGRIGTALGIGAMMVPAAYGVMKQYKDYKSAKNRDEAKVKKMVGGMAKKYSVGGGADTGRRTYSSMEEMRAAKGFKPGETPAQFNKRKAAMEVAKKAAKATRFGKIALGIGAAGVAAQQYLKSKMNKKKDVKKKMGGGMMRRPMGYGIGGGVEKAKEHKKIIKDKAGTALGYLGEMAKTISKATPAGAALGVTKKVAETIKNKKEQKRIDRFQDRTQMPESKRPKPALPGRPMPFPLPGRPRDAKPMPDVPGRKRDFKPMPDVPGRKRKAIPLFGGGMMQRPMGYKKGTMVKARGCKLGRSKPTKMY